MNRRLYRSTTDCILGGVAGGVADYLDADPALVRIIWAVLALVTGGIFLVLYIVMWIVVPEGDYPPMTVDGSDADASAGAGASAPAPRPRTRHTHSRGSGNGGLIFGLILIGIGAYFLIRQYVAIDMDRLWPIGLILVGVLLLVVALRRSPE